MKPGSKHPEGISTGDQGTASSCGSRAPYEAPRILVIHEDELLEILGPAQAYSGPISGTSGGGSL